MANKLRNFVYIDNISLNSHLSSMGEGVPEEIVQQSGEEFEKGGKAGIGVPGTDLGASGKGRKVDTSNIETKITLTAPYRFERLKELINEKNVKVFSDDDSIDSVSVGDVVEITVDISPMSLFKIEKFTSSILEFVGEETKELMDTFQEVSSGENDSNEDQLSEDDIKVFESLDKLVKKFSGSRIPLRADIEDYPLGIPVYRDYMRDEPSRVFSEGKEYTIFGRVQKNIKKNNEWDPALATNTLDRVLPVDEQVGPEFRQEIRQSSRGLGIDIDKKDMLIKSPGSIIYPIAIYW